MTAPITIGRRVPALLLGLGMIALGAAVLVMVRPPALSFSLIIAIICCLFGLGWCLLGQRQQSGHRWDLFRLINSNALTLFALVGLVEIAGRVSGYDFSKIGGKSAKELREEYPVCSRDADEPFPEVYFKHPGPTVWKGQPLRTLEVLRKGTDNAYIHEPAITVEHDSDGFRNPMDLKEWQLAIVGDSYTEQGYLPIEQVTSSIVGKSTGMTVKNLGVCGTGWLTYARYLERYGHSNSTNTVVFVIFEGNDVQDTTEEYESLERFKKTGERDYKDTGPQTSFVMATAKAISGLRNRPYPQSLVNAWFNRPNAEPLPITISTELPVDPLMASNVQTQAMREGLRAMAEAARKLNLTATIAYIPVNNRVYDGMVKFSDSLPEEIRKWRPNKLPEFVSNACREQGIPFVDTTPALRAAAQKGTYVHNAILDCHLNAEGARIVGEVIAEAIGTTVKPASLASQTVRRAGAP